MEKIHHNWKNYKDVDGGVPFGSLKEEEQKEVMKRAEVFKKAGKEGVSEDAFQFMVSTVCENGWHRCSLKDLKGNKKEFFDRGAYSPMGIGGTPCRYLFDLQGKIFRANLLPENYRPDDEGMVESTRRGFGKKELVISSDERENVSRVQSFEEVNFKDLPEDLIKSWFEDLNYIIEAYIEPDIQ